MNTYKYHFEAICPTDGARISYGITINSQSVIRAEDIVRECAFSEPTMHEQIADSLFHKFGGSQAITATHTGVHIETIRGGL